jgi:TolB-like protein
MDYLAEIRRRKLAQWLLAYAAGAWVALQVLGLMVDTFEWPRLVMRVGFLVAVTGSALALVLAWHHGEGGAQRASRKELVALAVVLLLGGGVVWKFAGSPPATTAAEVPATRVPAAAAPGQADDKSIAVLPFANLSGGADDALFADGLSEEIINSLARVPDLQVAARSSSFALRGSPMSAPELAAKLHVSHVLEGSIRRSGDRLRISVQLIRARDGFNAWTETYDRSNQDIIAIQEEVARAIAQALKTVTDPKALAAMQKVGTRSVPAYDAYLKGLALAGKSNETGDMDYQAQALASFDLATTRDPDFMQARLEAIGLVFGSLNVTAFVADSILDIPYEARMRDYKRRLDEAAAVAADPAMASYLQSQRVVVDLRFADALRLTQVYLSANPDSSVALDRAGELARSLGDTRLAREYADRGYRAADSARKFTGAVNDMVSLPDYPRAAALAQEGLRRFPDNVSLAYQAHRALLSAGKAGQAALLVPQLLASDIDEPSKVVVQLRQACAEGRRADAEALFRRIDRSDRDPLPRWHGLLLLGRNEDARRMLLKYDQPGQLYAIWTFMTYPKFDIAGFPNLRARMESQGIRIRPAIPEPYNCPNPGTKPQETPEAKE